MKNPLWHIGDNHNFGLHTIWFFRVGLCASLLGHAPGLFGQESVRDSSRTGLFQRVNISISGGGRQIAPVLSKQVRIPGLIWKERMAHDPYQFMVKQQTDEPFLHTAFWGNVEASVNIFHQNKLRIGVIAEHRGESFGVYSFKHLVLLPTILFQMDDSLKLGKKKISVRAETGFLEKVHLDEGLMFYNIDAQGSLLRLRGKKYGLEIDVLGDLFAGVGLGIDDAVQVRLKRFFDGGAAGQHTLSVTFSKFTRVSGFAAFENPLLPSLSYHYEIGRFHAGAQATLRTGNPLTPILGHPEISLAERLGVKIGVGYSVRSARYSFKGSFDCRYYGRFFNADNYRPNRTYRDYDLPIHGNYVGQHLYPLKNYFYDFGQWAVFTEYGIRELAAAAFVAHAELKVWRWLWCSNYLDVNVLSAEGAKPFVYPFYRTGFSIHFSKETTGDCFVTNKTMNLDVHYHTFYLTEKPYYGIMIRHQMVD